MLIPYPDSDTGPNIDLDSIPLELKLSPMTILEPDSSSKSESNEVKTVDKGSILSENIDRVGIKGSSVEMEESLFKKLGGLTKELSSNSQPHNDRVTMIYNNNL